MGSRVNALLALHVLRREYRLRAREADQAPAGEVLVAAVDRVGEHAFHRVRAHSVEECLCRRPDELRRFALFERGDGFVLLRRSEPAERLAVGLGAMGVELRDAAPVEVLLVCVGAGKREVDVVQYAGIGRARLARRAGHQPLGERGDGARIVVVEEGAMAAAHTAHA